MHTSAAFVCWLVLILCITITLTKGYMFWLSDGSHSGVSNHDKLLLGTMSCSFAFFICFLVLTAAVAAKNVQHQDIWLGMLQPVFICVHGNEASLWRCISFIPHGCYCSAIIQFIVLVSAHQDWFGLSLFEKSFLLNPLLYFISSTISNILQHLCFLSPHKFANKLSYTKIMKSLVNQAFFCLKEAAENMPCQLCYFLSLRGLVVYCIAFRQRPGKSRTIIYQMTLKWQQSVQSTFKIGHSTCGVWVESVCVHVAAFFRSPI